jgi:N-acetylglucosamine kinase-like BadF-type ATPase
VPFFLAIDGGGSKTFCVVADESKILGRGTGGPSNIVRVGELRAKQSLREAIREACVSAKVVPEQISRTCIGLSGGARQEISSLVHGLLSEIISGEIEVVGDMEIALRAAFGEGPGVVVIAGTGSIAFGRNFRGHTMRAGGWGHAISDEGSGHWIGRTAISSVMRSLDEGENPALLPVLLKAWSLDSREKLIVIANATPGPDFSALMPAIVAAADQGDPTARTVLADAGSELAGLAKIVLRRMFPEGQSVPVAIAGGVFSNSALVRQVFYNSLRSEFPSIVPSSKVVDPVLGALDIARRPMMQGTGT